MSEQRPFDALLGSLEGWLVEHALFLIGGALLLLVVQTMRLAWLRGAAGRRVARHRNLGADGEKKARRLLSKAGFRILEAQDSGAYNLVVDGETATVHLRADYVVEKAGQRFVAEVKSGVESAKITGRATRRQLLEYLFAFDVDGVLLVDMVERRIRQVRFPELKSR